MKKCQNNNHMKKPTYNKGAEILGSLEMQSQYFEEVIKPYRKDTIKNDSKKKIKI